MRGRKARGLTLEAEDASALRQVARGQSLPWFQVRRARTVLAVADGDRVEAVADRLGCDRATVWRTCRLYERDGLAGLLSAPPRSGSLTRWAAGPSAASSTRSTSNPTAPGTGGRRGWTSGSGSGPRRYCGA